MKRYFKVVGCLLIALSCISFYSCGGDDDGNDSGGYNLTDEQALATLQGTWNVTVWEAGDSDAKNPADREAITETRSWEISGNKITSTSQRGYSYTEDFTLSDGVIRIGSYYKGEFLGDPFTIIRLTKSGFEFNDAAFNDGKVGIKFLGTRK